MLKLHKKIFVVVIFSNIYICIFYAREMINVQFPLEFFFWVENGFLDQKHQFKCWQANDELQFNLDCT